MSWQAYVDDNLVGTGKIAHAAIYGHDGTLWAASKGFNPSHEEIKTIIESFSDAQKIQANGIHCNGVKYVFLNSDELTVRGKKGAADGIVAEKTNQAVIIGIYAEGTMAGQANKVVGDLADYLRGLNY
ncbi:389_t:CDS:2, partial [Scutellospora calospora]